MLTRRGFLAAAGLALLTSGDTVTMVRRMLSVTGPGGAPYPGLGWSISGAASIESNLAAMMASNAITVTVGTVQEVGYRPASVYNALWTRDHSYVLWHYPELLTAAQRREFVTYTLSRRTTGSEVDPDGGFLPPDFIADRITSTGVAAYKNAGASKLPFMDGIAFVVLALWTDWLLTGDTSTFTASQSAIDDCLAAIPRSANGCVYSDPAHPSVDYGFTDTVKKTGDCAYGTALQAWAYKMLSEIAGEGGSGTYSTLRADAESGLATLRNSNGFYKGSSVNNATRDDVWATALAVAEGLITGPDQVESAQALADAYVGGTITQFGLVRHLPTGQTWAGTSTASGHYQNGGYWLTPLWDCVRAVALVSPSLARTWAAEAMTQLQDERTAEGTWLHVPEEWHNYTVGVGAKGYSASAAEVHRFV
jgi:hypothetical protein